MSTVYLVIRLGSGNELHAAHFAVMSLWDNKEHASYEAKRLTNLGKSVYITRSIASQSTPFFVSFSYALDGELAPDERFSILEVSALEDDAYSIALEHVSENLGVGVIGVYENTVYNPRIKSSGSREREIKEEESTSPIKVWVPYDRRSIR